MKPDTVLTLGDFEFARFEIPNKVNFGGKQNLVVHTLVGGTKVVDAMGATETDKTWSGFFVNAGAVDRALYLDGLRKAGNPLTLTWDVFRYTVVIKSFEANYERFYRVPYTITLEVLSDETDAVTTTTTPSIDDLISQDAANAAANAALIDAQNLAILSVSSTTPLATVAPLSPLLIALNAQISAVGAFSTASQSTLNPVLLAISAARTQIGVTLSATTSTITGVATLGGVVPGAIPGANVANLQIQLNATTQAPLLVNMDKVLGRMQINIGTINSGSSTVTVAGGNLYSVAASQYGDPMGWTAIAAANDTTDPTISGVTTLTIPPFNNNTNGVLSP